MAEGRVQRRLAAILCADVAGYSRLMGEDEEGTLAALKSHRIELLEPKVAEFGGRVVKTTGDGMLAEFPSVVGAVECAFQVQEEMLGRNASVPPERRIELRIGINLGDVIVDDSDIYGDGVNVAARLERLAEPGGIWVSRTVHDQVRDRIDAAFDDLGEHAVKNIARPVRIYRVARRSAHSTARAEPPSLPDRSSIAVLPFTNLSGHPEQDYFADGMSEDIITALSRFHWFFVIARNSSFTYKGRSIDVRQVGRELGVRYVLEGSVRRAGDRLRITAQLVETATGNHLWAEKYDGAVADVFDLQDQITAGVVGAVEPSVRQAEIERARRKRPDSLVAYDLVLRALPHVWAHTAAQHSEALALLEEAARTDSNYGTAHGFAAGAYQQRFLRAGKGLEDRDAAVRHARTAVSTRTDDSVALALAGFVILILDRDYDASRGAVHTAEALNPNSAMTLAVSALVHVLTGEIVGAIGRAQRSLQLSPFDPWRYLSENALAFAYYCEGHFDMPVQAGQRAIQCNPRYVPGHIILAASYLRLGRPDESRCIAERVLATEPEFRIGRSFAPATVGFPALAESVTAALKEAGFPE